MKRSVVPLVVVLLLAGCGDAQDELATPAPSPSPSPSTCAKSDVLLFEAITVGGKASAEEAATDFVRNQASGVGPCRTPSPPRTGPLENDSVAASCVEGYNATTIGNRAFAFDGTVVSIGPGATNRADKGVLDTVAVTFAVQEWFKGGTGGKATVDLMSPTSNIAGDETPLYEEGTRLLVSGEPPWGGEPLEDAIAWSCGGFTRYYEPAVADEWRRGTA